jgi:ornithine cyclodeaminase/alanine dehydrogenase-like protein (mu-crystallin family)
MGLQLIDAVGLGQALPMEAAIDALEAAFRAPTLPTSPLRTLVEAEGADLLMMPAVGDPGIGIKLVTVNPSNPGRGLPLIHAVYVLFGPGSTEPRAVIDGAALTALRTAAVSGLATRHLANPEAERLVIFGAGVQGQSHLLAMRAVRPVWLVTVVSRTAQRAAELADRARALDMEASVGGPEAVAKADLVCTCTTSVEPLFDGALLKAGAHVNAVGSYRPHTRELDDVAVARARIVVETRGAALAEAGDLVIPMETGVMGASAIVADLAEVVRGAAVRTSPEDITIFKSVGVAFEDLVVARAALDRMQR